MPDMTPSNAEMTRFILVRHGQTEWNRVERFRGRADVPLNNTGLAQAEATGRRIAAAWRPAAVYSSPLSRATQTAAAVARHFDQEVQALSDLVDIDYGRWQGLTPLEAHEQWPEMVDAWYAAPHTAQIPGGESLPEVRARVLSAVRELAARHQGQTVVLVGHTVVNRAILLAILGLGSDRFWRLRQEPCAINVFEAGNSDFTLVTLNDTCHLLAV